MPKIYYIGFIGTSYFLPIEANTVKEAKSKFADHENVSLSAHIIEKRK